MKVAVIGAGVIGLSVSAALLERGVEVSCFESDRPMSGRSAGQSRIFRLAHATPELVKQAMLARIGFAKWEEKVGETLIYPDECVISGTDTDLRSF